MVISDLYTYNVNLQQKHKFTHDQFLPCDMCA